MFKEIKEIKSIIKDIKKDKNNLKDEQGRKIVNIAIKDDSNFLSSYLIDNEEVISIETEEFLKHCVKHLHHNDKIHFVISSNQIDDNEKKVYPEAIKNYFSSEILEITRQLRHNLILSLIMLFIGACFFALAIIMEHLQMQSVLLNVTDVVAWVFVWEAVDIYALQRTILKINRKRAMNLMNAKISFKDL